MTYSVYKNYFDLEALIKDIKAYLPKFNEKIFRTAFKFAEEAHRGQLRKDKVTPYFVHPVSVVQILSTLHADEDVLISALLHDVPEDTSHDINEIKTLFGDKISFIVGGVTKLSKVHYQNNMPEREIESLKKMFLHSAKDPRVILIKLADRLHNMRTLQYVSAPEKRLRISRETLEIFVPMSNLLGIQSLKAELEDLCFKYLFPFEYENLSKIIESQTDKNKHVLKKFFSILEKVFKKNGISVGICERKQSLYTIYKKICAEGKTLDGVNNRIAVKLIVETAPQCYETLGLVHGVFMPKTGGFKDYIAHPKVNKYQSLHTIVFGVEGVLTELQIRTKKMDLEAEYGIAANYFYRNNTKINEDVRSFWVNKILELEKKGKTDIEFLAVLKEDIFQDRIFVFTPKGETVDLPKGATAIDFAYTIHTSVGNNASKVDINGKIVPVTSILKTGDVIKIITDEAAAPSLSWLSFIKTSVAREKIHLYLKQISKSKKIEDGYNMLQKEFDIAGVGLLKNVNFKRINSQMALKLGKHFNNFEELLIAVGEGEVKATDIVTAIKKPSKEALKGISVNVKVVAKNRFGLLKDIYEIFYKYALDMTYMKGWSSKNDKDAYFNVQITVSDLESIGHIFNELEQHVENVKYVYRVQYKMIYVASTLVFLTFLIWVFHPFVLRMLDQSHFAEEHNFLFNLIVDVSLLTLFSLILYITNLVKNYVPYIRNKNLFWFVGFGVPVIAVLVLLLEIFYFKLKLNLITITIEFVIFYSYLFINFFTFKKSMNLR